MVKGTRKYKGDPDSNLALVHNQPRNSAAYTAGRAKAGTPELLRRLNQVRLPLSKGSSRLPGFITRSVLEGLSEGDEATHRPAGTGSSGA